MSAVEHHPPSGAAIGFSRPADAGNFHLLDDIDGEAVGGSTLRAASRVKLFGLTKRFNPQRLAQ
jgi:hypothetical protein